MLPTKLSWPTQSSTIVNLMGGVDENLSSLQQTPGTLLGVANYQIAEGESGGYQSIKGYERYDGTTLSSEIEVTVLSINNSTGSITLGDTITGVTGEAVALSDGVLDSDNILTVEVELVNDTFTRGEDILVNSVIIGELRVVKDEKPSENFHSLYDTNRATIEPVGGSLCEGRVLGVTLYKDNVYAFRKKIGLNEVGMYVASTSSWVEIDTSSSPILFGDNKFKFIKYNFYAGSLSRYLYWVDGVNECRYFDGTTVTPIPNAGMVLDTPINISARSNRLYLAYAGGSLQYSALGDPTDWSAVNGAGEIGTGDEITDLVIGVGGVLVIFNTNSILIINGETPNTWAVETFSSVSGAYSGTAKRLLGTIFFLDDRGITTMEAADTFGDYAANSISEKFKKTLLANLANLTTSVVSRELNQYRLFFNNGLGIIVSFKSKDLQGATFIDYPISVRTTTEGSLDNKKDILLFTTDTEEYLDESVDGYVYVMDSGESFDGHNIITRMTTSYYHYRSPRNWKRFISVMVEGDSTSDTVFDIKADYDYGSKDLPVTEWLGSRTGETTGSSLYGSSEYGSAIYGSGVVLSRTPVYLTGFGTNTSFKISTNLRFTRQHVLQNLLVDYTILSRRV